MTESIIQTEKQCFVSGSRIDLDRHHCLHGNKRKKAEQYGLWVWLRHDIHMRLHEKDKALDRELERVAQMAFEAKYGHEKYMAVFGKSYL